MSAPIISTFGCRLNSYESAVIEHWCKETQCENAVIINTCAVTAQAVRKARQEIRRLARENPKAKLIVTGCAAQTSPQQFAAMPEVDFILGNQEKMHAKSWLQIAQNTQQNDNKSKDATIKVSDIMRRHNATTPIIDGLAQRVRAYAQIQNGCNHRCTFCIIPYGRGNSRSVPIDTIIVQINRFLENGYKEIVLTGVDIASWGEDLPAHPKLGMLVEKIIDQLPDYARLRISSIDAINIDPHFEDLICTTPQIMPHLHLSVQSGDDMILKRMKRRHLRDDIIAFCERIRFKRPEIVFGADLIAGFPTETDDMFQNTLNIISECTLTWLHIFPFSPRAGTAAARMPQLDAKTIRARAKKLRACAKTQITKHFATLQGQEHTILMESPVRGRCPDFSEVIFETRQKTGALVQARICGISEDGTALKARAK